MNTCDLHDYEPGGLLDDLTWEDMEAIEASVDCGLEAISMSLAECYSELGG